VTNATALQDGTAGAGGTATGGIRFDAVTKRFGDQTVIDQLDLDIEPGTFYALIGPSGCGKTTTLRMIGGFELPTEGRVYLDGTDVTDLPPNKREVNTVFQSYALFPHLSVAKNVAFGLERRGLGKDETRKRVAEGLEAVEMTRFADRRPAELSGGQQQRVALARALVNRPHALLLDEPLGALDLKLRRQLQIEIKRVHHEVGITFIHVTHDQEEAMTMADVIAVMNKGRIEQAGTANELYDHPQTAFVAGFLGQSNLIAATLEGADGENRAFKTHDGVKLSAPESRIATTTGRLAIGVRPEKIWITNPGDPHDDAAASFRTNEITGTVTSSAYLGVSHEYHVETAGGDELIVLVQNNAREMAPMHQAGEQVELSWEPGHTFVVSDEEGTTGAAA